MLNQEEKNTLLSLARFTLETWIKQKRKPTEDELSKFKLTPQLQEKSGAFVTLHINDRLRGCIGYIEPLYPLYYAVMENTVNASSRDPRFPPVRDKEIPQITIELSVMSPLQNVSDPEEIEVGKHGLVIEQGMNRGLLLPQVATEWKWDKYQFLTETCRKAGLEPDAWKKGAAIYSFAAQVFSEKASL